MSERNETAVKSKDQEATPQSPQLSLDDLRTKIAAVQVLACKLSHLSDELESIAPPWVNAPKIKADMERGKPWTVPLNFLFDGRNALMGLADGLAEEVIDRSEQ